MKDNHIVFNYIILGFPESSKNSMGFSGSVCPCSDLLYLSLGYTNNQNGLFNQIPQELVSDNLNRPRMLHVHVFLNHVFDSKATSTTGRNNKEQNYM